MAAPHPEYLLAMKCIAMRLGEEYHDREDVTALVRILGLQNMQEVKAALARYYSLDHYPVRALSVLEDLLESDS